ncbi:LTA synthase family protein [Latilactobacillus fuchuensis]|uniref:Arylsulfatase n=1 Tax=Latilactobacillus fuchuensis TaxID=164393 RepID=A0A2N9DX49_9LACO|nr:sulfatase-like hydrolase/transferase [Latilactobacillus fuchuensis]SPC39256.1 putative Arylsulfatase [Latilactobacillus fuchuensis]
MSKINQLVKNPKSLSLLTTIKVLLISLLVVIPNILNHTYSHLAAELVEIAIIILITQLPIKFFKYPAYLLSSLLFLIIVAQEWVRLLSGTFTTKTMFENINNIHALGPSLPKYVVLTVVAILLTFLPMRFGLLKHHRLFTAGSIVGVLVALTAIVMFKPNTAIKASYALMQDYQKDYAIEHAMKSENHTKILKAFENKNIKSGINKKNLDNMNVIVIFAEGTSRKVLEDDKYPDLMPAINQFASESIDVRNYYNHTAPTYRGIRGQLYSSYQFNEGYEGATTAKQMKQRLNTKLIGLPEILNKNGYTTEMINPEPKHKQFTPYLNNLGFDKVISGDSSQWEGSGSGTFLSDKDNLNLLFNQANSLNQKDKKFMLSTYTLQTHNGWDTDSQYGDGKNAVLNKFHNFDEAFSAFYKKFENSDLKDNTILILTTDHASYASPEYASTFDDKRTAFASTVPLMIKYPNSKHQEIDVKGRNSLLLTPTILDMLNIEDEKNYFMGTSLFTNDATKYEYTTEIGSEFYDTTGILKALPASKKSIKSEILKYDSISLNMTNVEGE